MRHMFCVAEVYKGGSLHTSSAPRQGTTAFNLSLIFKVDITEDAQARNNRIQFIPNFQELII